MADNSSSSNVIPPGSIVSMPRCLGCGTSVDKRGELCAVCAEKPLFRAPKAMIEVAPQPEPPYVRQGNFARVEPVAPPLPEES